MIKKHHLHWSSLVLFFLVLAAGLFYSASTPKPTQASHGGAHNLSGFAWSSNIGWVGFDADDVSIFPDGFFDGYAWSSNIGWIDLHPTVSASCPGINCPPEAPFEAAKAPADGADGPVTGWARACSVFNGDCSSQSGLKPNSSRGGWDGWIKMSGSWTNDVSVEGGHLKGFAWGSNVVGWLSFCQTDPPASSNSNCVAIDQLSVDCTYTPPNPITGQNVHFTATVSGGTPNYTYCWGGNGVGPGCTPGLGGDVNYGPTSPVSSTTQSPPDAQYPAGSVEAYVKVIDANGNEGQDFCALNVNDEGDNTVTLHLSGPGVGIVTGLDEDCVHSANGSEECEEEISVSSLDLTASFDDFLYGVSWGNCDNVVGNTCELDNITGDRDVFATFTLDTGGTPLNIETDQTVIRINQQSNGIPAISTPRANIRNESTGVGVQVYLISVKSLATSATGVDINTISGFPINQFHCNFGDEGPGFNVPCSPGDFHAPLAAPNGGEFYSFPFSITIDDLLWPVLQYSPYEVKLGVVGGADEVTLQFRYQPPDVQPE